MNEIVKANMNGVPAEMVNVCENLQSVLNNVNAGKKQLANAVYALKIQAEKSKVSFRDFIKNHFSAFDISDSRLYAYAQTAEMFNTSEYVQLWERIPVSKLEKMTRIKKAKTNTCANAFSPIAFLQCLSYHAIEAHNTAYEAKAELLKELKAQLKESVKNQDFEQCGKIKKRIETVNDGNAIEIPKDNVEEFYLNDGITRICAMPDSKIGELVKIYNQYSDIVKPEDPENKGTNGTDSNDSNSNSNDSNSNGKEKEKSLTDIIAETLASVQTMRERAEKDNVELPETVITAFVQALENFGK